MDQLLQLQSQFPEFWSKTLTEETSLQSLLLAYSYVYGNALQQWKEAKNELSPFTTDAYHTEYYKVIDIKKFSKISAPTSMLYGINYVFYELPLNTFAIDTVSTDISFLNSIGSKIIYDKILNKTFLALTEIDVNALTGRYLYIRELKIDTKTMINTYGSLFNNFKPLLDGNFTTLYFGETEWWQDIDGPSYALYLENIKAQIINMIRCAVMGGTVDALESLISVAMNNPYVTEDGIIVNFDANKTWIEFANGTIQRYDYPPKKRFQQLNTKILAYEAITECPVKIYSYSTNPNRFAQALLCEWAVILFQLLSLQDTETPQTLYFDEPDLVMDGTTNTFFDFGIKAHNQNSEDVNPNYDNPVITFVDDFTNFSAATLHPRIYEFFRNVMIAETPNNNANYQGAGSTSIDETWLKSVLEYFRPLHSKYVVIGFTDGGET